MSTDTDSNWSWSENMEEDDGCAFSRSLDTSDRSVLIHTAQWDVSAADKALIAAAPLLLAACKSALGAFEHNHCIDWGDLERAIEAATGGSERAKREEGKGT